MSTKSDCQWSHAVRETVSSEMPFKCSLWRSRGLHTTANVWKVFGRRNSVCLWNTRCFVAQLTRDVTTNYHGTYSYVSSATSRHISTARSFPTSLLRERGRGFTDEWLIWPLVLMKVKTDYYVHSLQCDLSIPIEGAPLHDRLIMRFAKLWCTKIGAMTVH